MLYHASQTPGIEIIEPHISNHKKPLVYFSEKRENTLVYLSNAVQKHCRKTGFAYEGIFTKWASYGFNKEGILVLDEYYPNASRETYEGVEGYVYSAADGTGKPLSGIPFAFVSCEPVKAEGCEHIPDAYAALLQAAEEGKIIMNSYENNSPGKLEWINKTVREEYADPGITPEYKYFLKCKFGL